MAALLSTHWKTWSAQEGNDGSSELTLKQLENIFQPACDESTAKVGGGVGGRGCEEGEDVRRERGEERRERGEEGERRGGREESGIV
jgi:hypothetical protein